MADAVPMIERLQALGQKCGKQFGVKLTNTFPVQILEKELPGEQMYMAGKALLPLTITLAAELSRALDGKLAISYSGGATARASGIFLKPAFGRLRYVPPCCKCRLRSA